MCFNTEDRTADPGSGSSICPYPQAEPRQFYSPSPTALCLWLDPRSAAAGPLAPPSRNTSDYALLDLMLSNGGIAECTLLSSLLKRYSVPNDP